METNLLHRRWNEGTPALGTFVFSRDAATTDIAAHAKYDFVIIDLEHAPLDLHNVENHIRAAGANGICALVRIPGTDQSLIGRVLDLGADGVVYPHFGVDVIARVALPIACGMRRAATGPAAPPCGRTASR